MGRPLVRRGTLHTTVHTKYGAGGYSTGLGQDPTRRGRGTSTCPTRATSATPGCSARSARPDREQLRRPLAGQPQALHARLQHEPNPYYAVLKDGTFPICGKTGGYGVDVGAPVGAIIPFPPPSPAPSREPPTPTPPPPPNPPHQYTFPAVSDETTGALTLTPRVSCPLGTEVVSRTPTGSTWAATARGSRSPPVMS